MTEDNAPELEESPQAPIAGYVPGMSVVAARIYRELLEILEQRATRDSVD